MKKSKTVVGVLGTGMLLLCGLNAFGQQKEPAPQLPASAPTGKGDVLYVQGDKMPTPAVANTFSFVNSEFVFDGKPIKGAPYSAEAVTETIQVLGDGNRIINRSTAALYRDSEGRTRREQTLKAIGGVAVAATPFQTIMISDPVAGFSYSLDPLNRTAHKTSIATLTFQRTPAGPGSEAGSSTFVFNSEVSAPRIATEIGVNSGGAVTVAPSGKPPSVTWTGPRSISGDGFKVATTAGVSENVNKEDLGTQTIEGVSATGTRVTFTIPVGQIGNERPIEIVDERWFSNDLHMFVMTRHSDPRSGETVYRLTNITRSEPDHSLFELPADYQVKEPTMVAPRMRKLEND
jgi:hypothetical protein